MTISDKSRKTIQSILDLEEENKLLKEKVRKLENKYAWGLQPIDYALVRYGTPEKIKNLKKDEYYTEEELSDEDLYTETIQELSYHDVQIFGWDETVEAMIFRPKLEKLLATLAMRDGGD